MVVWDDSKKYTVLFFGLLGGAALIISTLVYPFWNLIREDVYEDTVIFSSSDGKCSVSTSDNIPKIIKDCNLEPGTPVTVKYGEGLAWASIVNP
ncbi:MAG: hypothetical protein ACE5JT_02110 [Nitrosopumilaceae archaeon]